MLAPSSWVPQRSCVYKNMMSELSFRTRGGQFHDITHRGRRLGPQQRHVMGLINADHKSADWLHKAKTTPTLQFKEEVDKYLTGNNDPSELIYFKVFKSQVPVIEQALETAARMLGSDRSRGYCLEMICADFLAGANLENGKPDVLLMSLRRMFGYLSAAQQRQFFLEVRRSA